MHYHINMNKLRANDAGYPPGQKPSNPPPPFPHSSCHSRLARLYRLASSALAWRFAVAAVLSSSTFRNKASTPSRSRLSMAPFACAACSTHFRTRTCPVDRRFGDRFVSGMSTTPGTGSSGASEDPLALISCLASLHHIPSNRPFDSCVSSGLRHFMLGTGGTAMIRRSCQSYFRHS